MGQGDAHDFLAFVDIEFDIEMTVEIAAFQVVITGFSFTFAGCADSSIAGKADAASGLFSNQMAFLVIQGTRLGILAFLEAFS